VEKAVQALKSFLDHKQAQAAKEDASTPTSLLSSSKKENSLGKAALGGSEEEDEFITLILTTKKMPTKSRINPVPVPLTHPLMAGDVSICFFSKDPQGEYKGLVPPGTKVIGIEKLKKKYKQYQEKRLLCDSYELFLADARVLSCLPPLLGKTFFDKKK
jgi:hypothetical protein